jgi:predicted nucleic acid-binding protein
VIVHLDTSVLIDALAGGAAADRLRAAIVDRHRLHLSSLVLFEWQRGPRTPEELRVRDVLFPTAAVVPFGLEEARTAARLYQAVKRPRGREVDLAIAACALEQDASLWTLNRLDFQDIPGLRLF